MHFRSFTFSFLAVWLAILLVLPAGPRAQAMDDSADPSLLQAVEQIVEFQDAWMAEHDSYCGTVDLEEHIDGRVLDNDIFPSTGGVIRQLLATDGQAYILLARDLTKWQYITAASSGELFYGWSSDPDQIAYAAVSALTWAENAMFAGSGRFGTLGELHSAGLIGENWEPYMSVIDGQVVLLESGAVLTLSVHSPMPSYQIVAEGGSGQLQTNLFRDSIERTQVESDFNTLLLEKARNSLRTVVSANAAHYASYGEYNTLPVLAERQFLRAQFGETDPADLSNGIRMFVVVLDGGQAYHAVSTVLGVMYYANETGEILEYSVDEAVDIPEIEKLRTRAAELLD